MGRRPRAAERRDTNWLPGSEEIWAQIYKQQTPEEVAGVTGVS